MKDINKMLNNSYNVYTKNPNLSLAFEDINKLPKRCDEFLDFLRRQVDHCDLQNSLDAIVLTDEIVKVQVMNYSEDVTKQLNGVTEKDFLEKNLKNLKTTSSSEVEYIGKLKSTVAKIENMITALIKCKSDLAKLETGISTIESKFNYVIDTVEKKQLYGNDALKYIRSVLGNRLDMQPETLESINETRANIDELVANYQSMKAIINREIEIVSDLHNMSIKNEENCKLLERE
ncbi:MAG: hypothetical protein IJZ29_03670 [Clostridia bacterium]|nr:hypothetical protein [Clostridia bacterium]